MSVVTLGWSWAHAVKFQQLMTHGDPRWEEKADNMPELHDLAFIAQLLGYRTASLASLSMDVLGIALAKPKQVSSLSIRMIGLAAFRLDQVHVLAHRITG